jgi:Subtilase family
MCISACAASLAISGYRQDQDRSICTEGTVADRDNWPNGLEEWIADEIRVILDAFDRRKDGPRIDYVREGGGLAYMFAAGQLLVREQYLDQVLRILGLGNEQEFREPQPNRIRRVIAGVVLITTGPATDTEQLEVPDVLVRVDEELGAGVATPNHVLTVSGDAGTCPATEPEQIYNKTEPYPSVCHDGGGQGVLVYMADTGLLHHAERGHPWLDGVRTGGLSEDWDPWDPPEDPADMIPPYTAHGTFVAGVARCMAPGADIEVTNAFEVAGSTLESDLVPRLARALGRGVDIFNLTVAAPSRFDLPLLTFEAWLGLLRQYKGVVCLAAAGNSDTRRPHWPGAFREVIAVGALGADWRGKASFSNYGGWVDVYAPGRDLVNAYTTGTYECQVYPYKDEKRKFYGMAKWNGTSFSTPIVTGLIASRMSRTGENAQQAAAALLAEARAQAVPGVGAVLLPDCPGERRPSRACGCCTEHRHGHCGCH